VVVVKITGQLAHQQNFSEGQSWFLLFHEMFWSEGDEFSFPIHFSLKISHNQALEHT